MTRFWAVAALGAALVGTAAHAAPIFGDADGNASLNMDDVKTLARVAGGLAPATMEMIRYSDVAPVTNNTAGQFGDGRITILDVVRVARQIANPQPADYPAKITAYAAQTGNTFTTRKFGADGVAKGDVVNTAGAPFQQVVGGVTYIVNPVNSADGEQWITSEKLVGGQAVPFTDAQGRAALGALQVAFGDTVTAFDPPLVLAVYPFQAGTSWTGSTKTTIQGQAVTANYTGTVNGMETLTVPAGTFDNAWKVTVSYTAKQGIYLTATGKEVYWFVPWLGPIQHGYDRKITALGQVLADDSVHPDMKLVNAVVHGARFP